VAHQLITARAAKWTGARGAENGARHSSAASGLADGWSDKRFAIWLAPLVWALPETQRLVQLDSSLVRFRDRRLFQTFVGTP